MYIDSAQIERLRPMVEAETGMDFTGSRFRRLCDAVAEVLPRDGSVTTIDVLLDNSAERALLLEQLTAKLTIGESFFFRNEHHFQALREEVFPEILRRNDRYQELRTWSAGCAGGEEPYSLAILLDQLLGPRHSDWLVSILATDINHDFLRRARRAEYRAWSFRRTDIHQDPKYFTSAGEKYRLSHHVRDRARFLYLNLVKDVYPSPLTSTVGMDLILFRNVAIYLQPEVIREIVKRFHQCLQPGGWLLLGEAEVSQVKPEGFEVRRFGQATFFQKPLRRTACETPPQRPQPVLRSFAGSRRATAPAEAVREQPQQPSPRTLAPSVLPAAPAFDWQRVEQCLAREDYAAAESEFAAIHDQEQRAMAKLKYVGRLLEHSQFTQAHKTLDACLEEAPLIIDGYLLKASLSEERGDFVAAESACRRALYLDRHCAMAHFHLALIQQQTGDAPGARKSLLQVQKLAKAQDANALVVHGDGVCYGRLWELAQTMAEL